MIRHHKETEVSKGLLIILAIKLWGLIKDLNKGIIMKELNKKAWIGKMDYVAKLRI